tara:strand:- start:389 stop:580 length:192 start_codon:yes stop_codon:yes gene_type:complete
MNTIRVMSIIGIVVFLLSIFCLGLWGGTVDNDAALGWGFIGSIYGIALAIVGIVQTNNLNKKR